MVRLPLFRLRPCDAPFVSQDRREINIGLLLDADRRTLQDMIAGAAVVPRSRPD
jgi:hypothetical protein